MFPESLQKLIDLFSKFPTVGKRTASRFVFYLAGLSKEKTDELIIAIQNMKEKVKHCKLCFNSFEENSESNGLCDICRSTKRDKTLLCVVEKETDLITIEAAQKYKGLYFILGGNVSTLKKADIDALRINELIKRVKEGGFAEVIVATNPTPEGKATAQLVDKSLKEIGAKITHLGQGLPVGGELEYADEETLESAFEGRK